MKHISRFQKVRFHRASRCGDAFTLVELLVILTVLGVLITMLVPGLARSRIDNSALRCMNNHRQLVQAWQMYAGDFSEILPAATGGISLRPVWMTGDISLVISPGPSMWSTNVDIVLSPIWRYTAKQAEIFRCPSDKSTVTVAGVRLPRVRSVSMSQVFGTGEWLAGGPNQGQTIYRTYAALSDIRAPKNTFVLADEHPDSINDSSLATQIANAEPTSPPGGERIIDFPASFHNGGCTFSFADGRVEVRKWIGHTIKAPASYDGLLPLNVPVGDSGIDIRWLAKNTTVRR